MLGETEDNEEEAAGTGGGGEEEAVDGGVVSSSSSPSSVSVTNNMTQAEHLQYLSSLLPNKKDQAVAGK